MKITRLAPALALAALATLAVASPALSQIAFPNRCDEVGAETLNIRAYIRQTCFNRARQMVYVISHDPSGRVSGISVVTPLSRGKLAFAHSSPESPHKAIWVWDGPSQRFDPDYPYPYGYSTPEVIRDTSQAGAVFKRLFGYLYATP